MANNSVSPILSTIGEIKNGAPLIRAMKVEDFLSQRQSENIMEWARLNFMARALQTFTAHAGSAIALALSLSTTLYVVGHRESIPTRTGALALTYSVITPYFISFLSELFVQMQTGFAALERLLEYTTLPQERPHELPCDPHEDAWPTGGSVEFLNLSMRYRPNLPLALQDFCVTIEAKSTVGIVGRTGAGKSTLILALLRLVEFDSGTILIDGVDTSKLGLRRLRSSISIVPQDPVLHEGSVSHNLDPFGKTDEATLRKILCRARLDPNILQEAVTKGGTNLSAGERQLLCIARAMVQNARILVLDEATSNLDESSDETVQTLIREEFSSHTVLTIAHRLKTVIDYDKILVLSKGRLVEEGAPSTLLSTKGGELEQMAQALGNEAQQELLKRSMSRSGKKSS